LRSSLFWEITQRIVVIPCRRYGTNDRSRLHDPWSWDR